MGLKDLKIYNFIDYWYKFFNELEQELESSSEIKMFKLKLGGINDKELIQDCCLYVISLLCRCKSRLGNKEKALDMISWLNGKGAKFIEQPFKVDNLKGMSWLYKDLLCH